MSRSACPIGPGAPRGNRDRTSRSNRRSGHSGWPACTWSCRARTGPSSTPHSDAVLLRAACQTIIEVGGFLMSWVGVRRPRGPDEVKPVPLPSATTTAISTSSRSGSKAPAPKGPPARPSGWSAQSSATTSPPIHAWRPGETKPCGEATARPSGCRSTRAAPCTESSPSMPTGPDRFDAGETRASPGAGARRLVRPDDARGRAEAAPGPGRPDRIRASLPGDGGDAPGSVRHPARGPRRRRAGSSTSCTSSPTRPPATTTTCRETNWSARRLLSLLPGHDARGADRAVRAHGRDRRAPRPRRPRLRGHVGRRATRSASSTSGPASSATRSPTPGAT